MHRHIRINIELFIFFYLEVYIVPLFLCIYVHMHRFLESKFGERETELRGGTFKLDTRQLYSYLCIYYMLCTLWPDCASS